MGPSSPVSRDTAASPSFADLLKSIVADIQAIVRAEIRLAKAELREDGRVVGRSALSMAGSIVAAWFGLMFGLAAICFALALVMPSWLAAAIVSFVLLVTAAVLFYAGKKRIKTITPGPEKTVESMKENIAWAKDRMK